MDLQGHSDVLIVGAGLTGIAAALRLAQSGASVTMIDDPLPQARGGIGGFARFSGAKFSLPPAGMGLLPLAGSKERFEAIIDSVLDMLELHRSMAQPSWDRTEKDSLALRCYESILLTPGEMSALLDKLEKRVATVVKLMRGRVTTLRQLDGHWIAEIFISNKATQISADAIFYAAGRLSDDILINAGASPVEGKGLDLGVRLEFLNKEGLSKLRKFGPDAKVLYKGCRTFCLNSPGHIYRYEQNGFSVPGGVVANPEIETANVGILLRVPEKLNALKFITNSAKTNNDQLLIESDKIHSDGRVHMPPILDSVFGYNTCQQLGGFINMLHQSGLIDLNFEHRVHIPLMDWHWNTFALPNSHQTNLHNVFALGDSSGHARGLLQACMSGWLAAEEYLC